MKSDFLHFLAFLSLSLMLPGLRVSKAAAKPDLSMAPEVQPIADFLLDLEDEVYILRSTNN